MNIRAPELLPTRKHPGFTQERENYLRANPLIDPALIAVELGLSEAFVMMYQRKLGIRRCKNSLRMGEPGWVPRRRSK